MSNDKDFSWVWWLIIGIIILSWLNSSGDSSDYNDYNNDSDYCVWYDADPTQWTDMVCE